MNKIGMAIIAALLLTGCSSVAGPAVGATVQGYTVHESPACVVRDLSIESKALITRWWRLNQIEKDELTLEEYVEGSALHQSGKCGLLRGDIPVVIVLIDGTIVLGRMPDGSLHGFASDGQ